MNIINKNTFNAAFDETIEKVRSTKQEGTISCNIAVFNGQDLRDWVDYGVEACEKNGVNFKGIRTDNNGFSKLNITMDRPNGAKYNGVPVVICQVDFDTVEFVIAP